MKDDVIQEIRIHDNGSLSISPLNTTFVYIYREAMNVHWDKDLKYLYSPKPPEWSDWTYYDCFKNIKAAALEQSTALNITDNTRWVNVGEELKKQILNII